MDFEETLLTITFILDFGRYLAQSLCNIHVLGGGKLKITYASKDTALFDLQLGVFADCFVRYSVEEDANACSESVSHEAAKQMTSNQQVKRKIQWRDVNLRETIVTH